MRRFALRAAVVTTVAVTALVTTVTPAFATNWTDVWIQNLTDDKCANVQSAADGAAVVQSTCVDDADQLWTFTPRGGGAYSVTNLGTGKCLAESGTSANSPVQQFTCNTGTAQGWVLIGSGNQFNIRNVASNLCMNRTNLLENSPLVVSTCTLPVKWELLF